MDRLPPGLAISMLDFGPSILLATKDSIVAGNYHRGARGIEDTERFFTGTPKTAAAIARQHRINYVITCPTYGEFRDYVKRGGAASLSAKLGKRELPHWIAPVPANANGWRIYRVRPKKIAAAP
jgi:hypothetical protein